RAPSRRLREIVDAGRVRHVAADRPRLSARLPDFPGDPLDAIRAPGRHDHRGALRRELAGDRRADPLTAARNDGDGPGESHAIFSITASSRMLPNASTSVDPSSAEAAAGLPK